MGNLNVFNTPLKIGGVTIKNRFIVAPMTLGDHYDEGGGYNDRTVNYYALRAKGGFGLIIPGASTTDTAVDPYSALGPDINTNPHWAEGAKKLVDAVHEADSKIFCQISMGLGRNYEGLPSPSDNIVFGTDDHHSPVLTTEQIKKKIGLMVSAAEIAQDCGYDGVEIHAMHWGYLLDQMGSGFFNRREDEYGGSLKNRLRAAKEIVEGIKETCGRDFPVIMRLGLQSFVKDYNKATIDGSEEHVRTLEEGVEISKLLEQYGYDALDTDAGMYDSFYYACPPMYMPQGFQLRLAKSAKAAVKIPVLAAGRMQDYEQTSAAIENGELDGVTLGRPSLADPEYPNKIFAGTPERIRPCLGCNLGCFNRALTLGQPASCAVNPTAGRETDVYIKPGNGKKKVVIVGGGAGGMEAAYVSAKRGYDVVLFEKSEKLGGHLAQAGAHEFKVEISRLNRWFENELRLLKVDVRLNHEACIKCVEQERPDAVILATGSHAAAPSIPGLEQAITSLDAIDHEDKIGKKAVVVGGGLVGCEIAYDLARKGHEVTIVEALDKIMAAGGTQPMPNTMMMNDLLEKYHVNVLTSTKLMEVRDGEAIVEHEGGIKNLAADTIISALGFKPNNPLEEDCKKLSVPVKVIGDAVEARTIMMAVWEGFDAANEI